MRDVNVRIGRAYLFAYPNMFGVRFGRRQVDVLLGRWRPLSVRMGWRVEPGLDLGFACIRWGRLL